MDRVRELKIVANLNKLLSAELENHNKYMSLVSTQYDMCLQQLNKQKNEVMHAIFLNYAHKVARINLLKRQFLPKTQTLQNVEAFNGGNVNCTNYANGIDKPQQNEQQQKRQRQPQQRQQQPQDETHLGIPDLEKADDVNIDINMQEKVKYKQYKQDEKYSGQELEIESDESKDIICISDMNGDMNINHKGKLQIKEIEQNGKQRPVLSKMSKAKCTQRLQTMVNCKTTKNTNKNMIKNGGIINSHININNNNNSGNQNDNDNCVGCTSSTSSAPLVSPFVLCTISVPKSTIATLSPFSIVTPVLGVAATLPAGVSTNLTRLSQVSQVAQSPHISTAKSVQHLSENDLKGSQNRQNRRNKNVKAKMLTRRQDINNSKNGYTAKKISKHGHTAHSATNIDCTNETQSVWYECPYCNNNTNNGINFRFTTKIELLKHMNSHINVKNKPKLKLKHNQRQFGRTDKIGHISQHSSNSEKDRQSVKKHLDDDYNHQKNLQIISPNNRQSARSTHIFASSNLSSRTCCGTKNKLRTLNNLNNVNNVNDLDELNQLTNQPDDKSEKNKHKCAYCCEIFANDSSYFFHLQQKHVEKYQQLVQNIKIYANYN